MTGYTVAHFNPHAKREPLMRRSICLLLCTGLLGGCALRPRFRDLSERPLEADRRMRVVDPATGSPMREVSVELGDGREKLVQTTADDGSFLLPARRKYFDDNVIVVVNLPRGVTDYRIEAVPDGAPPAPRPEQMPLPAPPQ